MTLLALWARSTVAVALTLVASLAPASPVLSAFSTLASTASYDCVDNTCNPIVASNLAVVPGSGGVGQAAASAAVGPGYPTVGSASGTATVAGSFGVPVLKAGAAAPGLGWLAGQALAVQAYTYSGAGETLQLDWHLTGSVHNPDGDGATGLVTFAGFFTAAQLPAFPDVSNPLSVITLLVGLSQVSTADDFRQFTTEGPVDTGGSLSLAVSDGDQFYLVMGLMAAAGGADARAESLSTFTAQFDGTPGLTAALVPGTVPVPATAALCLLALALVPATRRREQAAARG